MADVKRSERGMVTAELAAILPLGVAFGFLLLWIVSLGVTQVRLVDTAREGARMVARGDSITTAVKVARRDAPAGTKIHATTKKGVVTVTVTVRSAIPIPLFSHVGSRTLTATAVAADETP